MANTNLFNTSTAAIPPTDVVNRAGGRAYSMSHRHALAQYAATGMLGNTYYASAKEQLDKTLELANLVDSEFLAKAAVYSRQAGYLKDMPALLLAVLSTRETDLFKNIFNQVIDNGKMLRNFVQIMRSGVVGRRSLGTAPKKMVVQWLAQRSDYQIFRDSVGGNPSEADIIKMVHPRPETKVRDNLYKYIVKGEYDKRRKYPDIVKQYEAFKNGTPGDREIPNVPFQMLTSSELTTDEWKQIARDAKWHMTRMNLNTFKRHGVLEDRNMVQLIADRLKSEADIKAAKVFPYQIMTAYYNATDMPQKIRNALHDAVEVATENIPEFDGKIFIAVDCSGSMHQPVSGNHYSSGPSCNEVASLIACSILRKNEDTEIFAFDTSAYPMDLDARDTVLTNAGKLARRGGGTDVSCVLHRLNVKREKGDLVIIISDNESWVDRNFFTGGNLSVEWQKFKARNKQAKMVCIDLAANEYTQAKDRADTLNVGGFSDNVFNVINSFLQSGGKPDYWADLIEETVSV